MGFQDRVVVAAVTNIAIGVVAGLAVFGFLILPAMRHSNTVQNSKELIAANEASAAKDQQITSLEQQIEDMQKQVEDMQAQVDTEKGNTDSVLARIESYNNLITAYDEVNNKDYYYAQEDLEKVNRDDLDESSADAYDALENKIERNIQALEEESVGSDEESSGDDSGE